MTLFLLFPGGFPHPLIQNVNEARSSVCVLPPFNSDECQVQRSSSSSTPSDWGVRTHGPEPLPYQKELDLYSVCFPQVPAPELCVPFRFPGGSVITAMLPPPLLFIEARMHVALITEVIGKNQFSFRQETFVFALRRLAEVWQEGLALEGKAWEWGADEATRRESGWDDKLYVGLFVEQYVWCETEKEKSGNDRKSPLFYWLHKDHKGPGALKQGSGLLEISKTQYLSECVCVGGDWEGSLLWHYCFIGRPP